MTPDNIDVLLLICIPITALILLFAFHLRRPDLAGLGWLRQFGLGLIGCFPFWYFAVAGCFHKCLNGQSMSQYYSGLIFGCLIILFCRRGWRRIVSVLILFVVFTISVEHFHTLVHSGNYVGDTKISDLKAQQDRVPVAIHRLWHTSFSGLYSLETIESSSLDRGEVHDEIK